jgi:putative transposase
MARIARVVVPGLPHHVTQRGDRREPVFFEADDYRPFRRRAAAAARRAGVPVRAYCLMPNHVHLACAGGREWVAVIFAEARRHYTAAISIGSDGRTICSRVALARW